MRIGVIGALEQELAHLREGMHAPRQLPDGSTMGLLHGHELVLVRAGVGKVAAAMTTALLLERQRPDLVVNTGAAGAMAPRLAVHDIVLATELRQHDVDVCGLPDRHGQPHVAGQLYDGPTHFAVDPKLLARAQQAAAETLVDVPVHCGRICSGDAFIQHADQAARIRSAFPDTLAVEMEGAAVAQVAAAMGVPALVVRAISDRVGAGDGVADFTAFLGLAGERAARLVAALVAGLPAEK